MIAQRRRALMAASAGGGEIVFYVYPYPSASSPNEYHATAGCTWQDYIDEFGESDFYLENGVVIHNSYYVYSDSSGYQEPESKIQSETYSVRSY